MLKIFVFASLFFTFSLLPFPEFEQKRTLSRDFLEEVATEANKKMPLFIDDELKITHIEAREGMFIYHAISLTETNEDYADEQFMEEVRIDIAESICATQLKERFIAKGVTMRYRIQDIRENFLADIDVSQEDCSDQ